MMIFIGVMVMCVSDDDVCVYEVLVWCMRCVECVCDEVWECVCE